MLLNQLSPSHSNYMLGHTTLEAWHFLHGGEGSSFPGLVPHNDMVDSESLVGIKCGDYGVVFGYQVDEFTHIWSVEQFVAHSHIYPGFTGKVSSLTQW